jgi:hypothetical protein
LPLATEGRRDTTGGKTDGPGKLARHRAVQFRSKRLHRIAGLAWEDGALHVQHVADDRIDADTTGTGRVSARICYLQDALAAFAGKRLSLNTNGPDCPIRIEDPDDGAGLAIVMPSKW